MQGYLVALFFVIVTLVFAGCSRQLPATSTDAQTGVEASPAAAKVGQTTKTGQIIQLEGKYYLQQSGQEPLGIDSYNVDLSSSVGKTVTVTGEYSGNTLFVGKLE